MTYSIVAAEPAQGLLGIAIATSPPAIGSRAVHLRAGVGAVASQGTTDPALGREALDLLAAGAAPAAVLDRLARHRHFDSRQLGLVDTAGHAAAVTGAATEPHRGHLAGPCHAVQGNHLASADVLPAMQEAWRLGGHLPFEARLLAAITAGRDQGGDRAGTRSAALVVVAAGVQPRTDLRVDWQDPAEGGGDAVDRLAALLALWTPLIGFYQRRPHDPSLGGWEQWRSAP
jgi:uncharacterized Ntn-hydrolase superfamily protein